MIITNVAKSVGRKEHKRTWQEEGQRCKCKKDYEWNTRKEIDRHKEIFDRRDSDRNERTCTGESCCCCFCCCFAVIVLSSSTSHHSLHFTIQYVTLLSYLILLACAFWRDETSLTCA